MPLLDLGISAEIPHHHPLPPSPWKFAVAISTTFQRETTRVSTTTSTCLVCGATAHFNVTQIVTTVALNRAIPLGTYDETVFHCQACNRSYQANPENSVNLTFTKRDKALVWIQAALFVLPFIGLIFALIVLAITPRTSSFYRQWSKILMAGTLLVTAIVSFGLLVGSG